MNHDKQCPGGVSRRRFVQGLAAGGTLIASGIRPVRGTPNTDNGIRTLSGTEFDLDVSPLGVNFTGRSRQATAINGSLPAPILRWREGERVRLHVTNRLEETTSIHWHGIILPFEQDGVPGISFDGIQPGETFTYEFDVNQSGTYWYHSHSGFQEQTGMYGAIVIDPAGEEPAPADREHVLVLSDWTDEDPMDVYTHLKKMDAYYNYNQRTVFDLISDMRHKGVIDTLKARHMWNTMRMSSRDLSDVTAATYTYLVNGAPPAGNWTGLFRPGETVKLRIINAAAMTFFDLRIPGLEMTVVAADGQPVKPVTVDEFRIGVAETYDVLVRPTEDRAYTVFAQALDRSGFTRATLAPRAGMSAPVPEMDPRPERGMEAMGAMHSMHGGNDNMDASSDMSGHTHHGHHDMQMDDDKAMEPAQHAPEEYGPGTAMRVDYPSTRLDEPGVGLPMPGRRCLTYADLEQYAPYPDQRAPERDITLHLTGNMERYMWSFDGVEFSDAEPLIFHYGERLRINLHNDTMMDHPIHLHGMWSDLETGDGRLVRKHTVIVKPGERISYQVSADALGGWAYHCHLLYHMAGGMFREVRVEEVSS
jgi:CopA family copper-resistance protein